MALTRKSSAGASSTSSGVIPDFPNFAPAFVDAPGGVETNEAIQSWWSTAKYQLLALQNGNQQSVDRLTAASDTNVGTLQAEIDNEKIVRANADSALASSISSVSASLTTSIGVVAASVVTEATARATADGYLAGKYTLTVTAGDVVTGMNITSASGPGTNISAVTFVANDFLIYNNVSGLQMFAVSGSLIKLGSVLAVDNANAKLYIGTGNYAASDTAFYVDSAGRFSLKDKLTWDGTNLSVTGSITVTAISGLNYAGSPGPAGSANTLVGQGALATQNTAAYATQVTGTPISATTGALSLATSPSGSGLFLGSDHLGYYASGAWKTYMDNSGNFYLGGTSGSLQWNGTTLTISGNITVTGGNAAKTDLSNVTGTYAGSPSTGGAANTIVSQGALATQNTAAYATQVTGTPISASTGALSLSTSPSGSGLFLGSDHLGYYASGAWKTYMDSSGNFYLGGTSGKLQWNGTTLTIDGNGTFSGALSAATGTFSGALSAATGSFSGTITASSGTIGGFTIGATTLSATNITLDSGAATISVGDAVITTGGFRFGVSGGQRVAMENDSGVLKVLSFYNNTPASVAILGMLSGASEKGFLTLKDSPVTHLTTFYSDQILAGGSSFSIVRGAGSIGVSNTNLSLIHGSGSVIFIGSSSTNLYEASANNLKTDDDFTAAKLITAGNMEAGGAVKAGTDGYYMNGTQIFDWSGSPRLRSSAIELAYGDSDKCNLEADTLGGTDTMSDALIIFANGQKCTINCKFG